MNPTLPADLLQYLKTRTRSKRLVRVGLALTSTYYSLRPDLLLAKSSPSAGMPARDWPIEGGPTPFTLPKFLPPSRNELFFIDAGVADPGAFWLAAPKGATVVCIPTGVDSWSFMAQEASRFEGLRAIHIVSHGQPGAVVLNGQHYAAADLQTLTFPLHQLGRALSKNGDIFLYGCEVGAGVAGQNLLNTLAALTGADIAASKDKTGNGPHGGNWDLEIVTGQIDPSLALNASSMAGYDAVLATFTVVNTSNSGAGSLRQAIIDANATIANDTIDFNFASGTAPYTITLAAALPAIVNASTAGSLAITGPGASALTIDANQGNFSILRINTGGNLTIAGATVTGANLSGSGGAFNNQGTLKIYSSTISGNSVNGDGGGILNRNGGTLNIFNSTISGNTASGGSGSYSNYGAGIRNDDGGTLIVSNSTIANNTGGMGGGISNRGTSSIVNSTLSGNTARKFGGGIGNYSALTVINCTFSGNSAQDGALQNNGSLNIANTIVANSLVGFDFFGGGTIGTNLNNLVRDGTLTNNTGGSSGSGNISGDPVLSLLADNGGPTFTMALGATSPAIAAGNATVSNAAPIFGLDQRGYVRSSSTPSIGAFELTNTTPPVPSVTSVSPSTGSGAGGTSITITGTDLAGATSVTIGGTAVNFTVVSSTSITTTTPAHTAGAVSIQVTTVSGTNTANTLYTYRPTVTQNLSNLAINATTLIITGTGFDTIAANNTVTLSSGTGTVISATATQLTVTFNTAPTPGELKAVVTTNSISSGSEVEVATIVEVPTITSISPGAGPTGGGTTITINGSFFTNVTAVTIGGIAASSFTVVNGQKITAITPPGTRGAANVLVTTTNGTNSTTVNTVFNYTAGAFITPAVPFSPAFPHALSINAPGSAVTDSASFTVTFNQPVSGVDAADFTLVATGTVANGTISSITGSGATYTVNVTGITGVGTLGLNLVSSPTITAAPSFAAQATFSTGSKPASVISGDVDGDGKLDLITANFNSASVSVLLGNGNGTFKGQQTFATGTNPFSVTLGDVNGDGLLDIITANQGSNNASVLLGNGDGAFKAQTTFATGTQPRSVALGDVNGDGTLDIITANQGSNNVSVLLGTGNGSFARQATFATASLPYSVALGDVNGDGKLDIVAANRSGSFGSLLLGNGDGTFKASEAFNVGGSQVYVALGDLNGDGKLDIVTPKPGNDVVVLIGNGNGTFKDPLIFSPGVNPRSVTLGDVNGDGILDITTANFGTNSNNVSVLLGNGNGTFKNAVTFATGTNSRSATLGDVNGDGRLDIIAANYNSDNASVLLGTGGSAITATFSPQQTFAAGNGAQAVALGDLNSDGKLDVVTANGQTSNVSVLLGNGNGTLQTQVTFSTGTTPRSVALGDVNGDGRLDIITANRDSNTASVLLGNGNGTFQTQVTFSTGSSPRSVALGDVNGDGRLDIVIANNNDNNVSVLLGNGNGTFQAQATFATGSSPRAVTLGDVNGDGRLDIIAANNGAANVSVLLGNGNGTFQAQATFATGSNPRAVTAGDVNGDGKLDIITANFADNTASVLLGNGNGTFQTQATFATNRPYSVALGDVNGDGRLDIITANYSDDTARVLLGNGNGTFQTQVAFAVGDGPLAVALGDLNGDGRLDLATANSNSGNASVLLNSIAFTGQTAAVVPSPPFVSSPTSASIGNTSATLGGDVTATGNASLTAVGVVYAITSANSNPQLSGTGVTNVAGTAATGVFTVSATGLTAGTAYSYAVYATNSVGTTYTSVGTFTTTVPTPMLTFATPSTASVAVGATQTNAVTSTLSGGSYGAISYTSSDLSKATVDPTTGVVTGLTVGTITITATQAAAAGFNATTSTSYTLTVTIGTPTITAAPSASGITYGQTLASSTLTGGTASTAGTFTFTTTSTAPSAGTAAQGVTFTPTDTTNYTSTTTTVNVAVAKATPTISVAPTASGITYAQTLASAALSSGTASVPGAFAFTTTSTAPNAGTAAQGVTFTPSDTTNYNSVTTTVNVTVAKATPTISVAPTASGITYGQTLASSALSSGTASVPGAFAFTTTSTAPNAGTAAQGVTFTPTDTTNYTSTTTTVNVTVAKATPTISVAPTASGITYGQTLASSTLSSGTASVPGAFAFTTTSAAPNAGTAAEGVTFTPTDTTNYTSTTTTANVTVAKATPTITAAPSASGITYGQTLASSTLTGGTASTAGTFTFTTTSTAPSAGTAAQGVTFTPSSTANYNPVTTTANVTVAKATPTVTWATPSAIPYGTALSATQLNATASVAGSFTYTPASGTALTAGSQTLSVGFTPTDAANYHAVAATTVSLTVDRANQTISFGTLANKTYGAASFTVAATASSSLTPSYSIVSGPATLSGSTVTLTGAGTVVVRASQAGDANYNAATSVDQTFTVAKATLMVTADAKSRVYGAANPTLTAKITGYVNSETSAVLSGAATVTTTATTTSTVGDYAIIAAAGALSATNYDFSFTAGTLTVSKAPLTVTAEAKSRIYGDANPTLTATISGYVNSETSTVVSGTAAVTTTATASSNVGSYAITPALGSLSATNYSFSFTDGTLTVGKAALSVTADNQSKIYGAANPALTAAITGFKNSETIAVLAGTPALSTAATPASGVASYAITAAIGTLASGNYSFGFVDGTLAVTKAPLTVTADAKSRVYGVAEPTFTATLTGFVNGESLATSGVSGSAAVSTTATLTSAAGTYPLSPVVSTLTASNYAFTTFTNGTLTIGQASQTITFGTLANKTYGAASFTVAATASSSLTPSYSIVSGPATLSGSTVTLTGAGTVVVRASQAGDGNHTAATAVDQTFTVAKATLMVTADAKSRVYGAANPTFTATIAGYVNSETSAVLSGTASVTTTATTTSTVGDYAITAAAGTLSATNYDFSFTAATLTVSKASLSVAANPAARVFGAANPTFTATLTGFVNSETLSTSGVTGGAAFTTAAGATSIVGAYAITPAVGTLASANYAFTAFTDGVLTISQASAAVALGNLTQTYSGSPRPVSVTTSPTGLSVAVTYDGNAVAPVNAGSYAVLARVNDGGNYFGTVVGALTVAKAAQTLAFTAPTTATLGKPVTLAATASSGLPVTFAVTGPAALSGSALTFSAAGTATVTATQAGDGNTLPATATVTVTAGKVEQTIAFTAPAAATFGKPVTLAVTASSGLPVTFAVTGPAALSGSTLTFSAAGTATVTATQAGDGNTLPATATVTVTAAKAAQTIALTAPATATVGAPVTLFATASSGLPVTLTVTGPAALSGSTLTFSAAGTVTVTATQAGDGNTLPATATATVTVTVNAGEKQLQTIAFAPLGDRVSTAGSFALNATASSGLPVTFAIVSGPALLAGSTVNLSGAAGLVVIRAAQPGNLSYGAAPEVTRTFTVSAPVQAVYFGNVSAAGSTAKSGDVAAVIPPGAKQGALLIVAPGVGVNTVLDFTVNPDGTFNQTITIAAAPVLAQGASTERLPSVAAAPMTLTVRGTLVNGRLQGVIEPLGLAFSALVQPTAGPSAGAAGFYTSNTLATTSGATYSVVGTNNQVLVLATTPELSTGGLTSLAADGTFSVQTQTANGPATFRGAVDESATTVSGSITLPGQAETTFAGLRTTTTRTDRLINLSSRLRIGAGGNVLIAGFVIGGTEAKQVLIRGIGPALAGLGVQGTLANPQLRLYRGSEVIAQNDDWSTGADSAALASAFQRLGAFALAPGSKDAALLVTLAPGAYTAHIVADGVGGVALAEIYDASGNPNADYQRLINISTRGDVGTGENILIGGFIVTGNAPKKVLVRAIGPSLTAFGVAGALADPRLRVFNGAALIAENDNWSIVPADTAATAQAARDTGAFALANGSKDAALILTLAPGAYTAQVSGADGTSTGVALIEVYEVP